MNHSDPTGLLTREQENFRALLDRQEPEVRSQFFELGLFMPVREAVIGIVGGRILQAAWRARTLATTLRAAKGVAADAKFAQKTYGALFHPKGKFAGMSVKQVADALRSKAMKPAEVTIDYIVRDGQTIILNTRSAQALEAAGIPRSQWNGVNRTGNPFFEGLLDGQLGRNPGAPFNSVRPSKTP